VRSPRCQSLFLRLARGAESASTAEVIIAEVAYVLTSKKWYGLTRQRVQELLEPYVYLRGLEIPNKRQVLRALQIFGQFSIDFEDALTVARVEQEDVAIVSYDRDFDKVPGIVREEP
jgi:predicted nucleic acid-binding protein